MTIEDLKKLLDGSDLAALLPDLEGIVDKMAPIMRLALMAGPVLFLALGLMYLFVSPKEANYKIGYRCYFGMGSVTAWRYTQRLAGIIFTTVGLILTIVMSLICNGYRDMGTEEMLDSALRCIGWIIGLTVIACLAIDALVVIVFDSKGFRRREN